MYTHTREEMKTRIPEYILRYLTGRATEGTVEHTLTMNNVLLVKEVT